MMIWLSQKVVEQNQKCKMTTAGLRKKSRLSLKNDMPLRDNSDHEDASEHIEKVLEIVDLFLIPNITINQEILRDFPMSLTGAASRWLRNKPFGLITTWEYLKIKFLSKYFPPARTAKKIEEINNFQQESDENLYQDWERFKELLMTCPQHYLTEMQEVVLFYNGLDVPTRQILDLRAIQAQLNNIGREIKKVNEKVYVAQVGCEQCKGPHYTKDFPLKEEGKTLGESYYTQFGAPFQGGGYREIALGFYQRNNANPSYQEQRKSMKDTLSKFMNAYSEASHINISIPKKKKDSESFTLPCFINNVCFDNALDDLGASVSVMPLLTYLNLGLGWRERMELDLEARLIGETLALNRSLDPFFDDYIELNDLNVSLELRKNQVDDLMPTIEEGEISKVYKIWMLIVMKEWAMLFLVIHFKEKSGLMQNGLKE
uniref:Retrotransposon gag domain-containing protein n=1 Tax=Tanacetum cinerariifolium TaxID=118510 RepID=A0A6L2NIV3_TANCI|nr:hypothetical protein [Tanacetum cinerariifolium]